MSQLILPTIKEIKYYQVLLFEPDILTPTFNLKGYTALMDNKTYALNAYANLKNPASQLIEANSIKELQDKAKETIDNMKDPLWVEANILPYL